MTDVPQGAVDAARAEALNWLPDMVLDIANGHMGDGDAYLHTHLPQLAQDVLEAAAPHIRAAERERRWDDAEDVDFSVRDVTAEDGFVWTRLACSICGPVDAAASPRDLGEIAASAQGHYERKHRNPERTTDHD